MVLGVDDGAASINTASEFNISIFIRDCTSPPNIRYHSFILPGTIRVDDLLSQVAERASVKPDNVCLCFMGIGQAGSSEVCLNDSHGLLADALEGVTLTPDSKLYFMVTLVDDAAKKTDSELSSIEYSPQNNSCDSSPLPALAESISLPGGDPSLASSVVADDRTLVASECSTAAPESSAPEIPAKRFVGLVNQAMTCYLNSLIQTLFMTPEFRNAIYSWDPSDLTDETSRSRSIPYQLQRLFLRLQFSNRQAVETTALTTSFGWDTSEVWEQHDVQELCRILLDALEAAWKGTDKSDLVDCLYQGKMEDYVQCLACNHTSSRVAKYQDISLAIRSFDAQISYGTLHEALAAFTKPEILTDDNRYNCEQCHEKQDASKGLRFQSFPRVVTMQLKRFDFDYRFGNRVKLNDRIFFPNFINLDRYIIHDQLQNGTPLQQEKSEPPQLQQEAAINGDVGLGCKSSSLDDNDNNNTSATLKLLEVDDPDDGTTICQYELFSILVHSGSASGGHYYAYIKNFDDGCFYCFNDRVVRRVPDEEIRLTYGSGTGSSSAYSYSTSAYMLMYRLCDKTKPTSFLSLEEMQSFPWLLKQIEEIRHGEDSYPHSSSDGMLTKANKYEDISMASTSAGPTYSCATVSDVDGPMAYTAITVFYIHPDDCIATPTRVRLPPTTTLTEAADIVVKELNLDKVPQQTSVRYRLVPYNNYTKVLGILEAFSAEQGPVQDSAARPGGDAVDECVDIPISELIKSSNTAFFLEVIPVDMPFRRFSCGSITLIVNLVDNVEMRVSKCAITAVPPTWTIGKVGAYVCKLLALPKPFVRMGIIERNWPSDDTIRHLMKLDSSLEREKLIDSPLDLYVENLAEPEDTLFPFRRTPLYRYVDFQINSTQLTVTVRFDRPNIPVVSLDESAPVSGGDSSLPIVVSSSQLVLINGSQQMSLPLPCSTCIDGYLVKCAFSKSEDDTIVASVKADKRLAVQDLAQVLATHMGFDLCSTVIWRDFGGHCEEQLRSSLSLEFISTSSRLSLRSGRVLTEKEYVVNVYQMEDAVKRLGQPCVERFSVVVENEWELIKMKQMVATFLKRNYGVDCCIGTCNVDDPGRACTLCSGSQYHLRLRRNRFSEPSRILASSEIMGKDCEWSSIKDIFFELLTDGPELKQNFGDLVVKALHWRPSQVALSGPVEICLAGRSSGELMAKLSSQFKIEGDNIEVASCSSSATNVSLLDLQDHVRWHSIATGIRDVDVFPLMLHEDGVQFYLRDKTEEMAQIDDEKRRQLLSQDGGAHSRSYTSSNGIGSSSSFTSTLSSSLRDRTSRPKEKSLKIYTHQSSPPLPQQTSAVVSLPVPPATTPTGACPPQLAVLSPSSSVEVSSAGEVESSSLMEVDKPNSNSVITGLDVD